MTSVINAPGAIWLNYGDEIGFDDEAIDHNDCGEVLWTQDHAATDFNVRYVRADLHEALRAQLAALQSENERLREGMKGDYDLDAWLDWADEAKALREVGALQLVEIQRLAAEIARLSALVPRWMPIEECPMFDGDYWLAVKGISKADSGKCIGRRWFIRSFPAMGAAITHVMMIEPPPLPSPAPVDAGKEQKV